MDAAPVQPQHARALPDHAVDKWDALRELSVARKTFGLSDRDLTVLQALLSFHPGTKLDDPSRIVVFPSNAKLCERLNGMPCSTMRRHLAHLVEARVIARRDSPNGKRYRRREGQTFGFDLSPLAHRFPELRRAADTIRAQQYRIATLREEISLLRRDALALLANASSPELAQLIEVTAKTLRRQLSQNQLESLRDALTLGLSELSQMAHFSADLSSDDSQNEQHQYNKETYIPESVCPETQKKEENSNEDLQIATVLANCDQIQQFSPEPIRDWHDLVRAADNLRPMMGICAQAWQFAIDSMGKVSASVLLAAILQRFDKIRSPGAYLRGIANRATRQDFCINQMIRSLNGKFTAVNHSG